MKAQFLSVFGRLRIVNVWCEIPQVLPTVNFNSKKNVYQVCRIEAEPMGLQLFHIQTFHIEILMFIFRNYNPTDYFEGILKF